LLTLQILKPWQKDPSYYLNQVNSSVFVIMAREFASLENRLALVISREKLALKLLKSSRLNLKNPPKIYTDIDLE